MHGVACLWLCTGYIPGKHEDGPLLGAGALTHYQKASQGAQGVGRTITVSVASLDSSASILLLAVAYVSFLLLPCRLVV